MAKSDEAFEETWQRTTFRYSNEGILKAIGKNFWEAAIEWKQVEDLAAVEANLTDHLEAHGVFCVACAYKRGIRHSLEAIRGENVDRREYPDAIPIERNTLLGVPEPKGEE